MVRHLVAFLCATLCACSAPDASPVERPADSASIGEAAAIHPVSGLTTIDVVVDTGEDRHVFLTELAATPEAQARGLMFRTELGDFEAMLFPSDPPRVRSFWMKNTPLPLDIVFIGPDGRIANIEAGVPYKIENVRSDGPAAAVLEIAGGRAAELGIEPGDRVEYTLP